jgi:hypothetical protein
MTTAINAAWLPLFPTRSLQNVGLGLYSGERATIRAFRVASSARINPDTSTANFYCLMPTFSLLLVVKAWMMCEKDARTVSVQPW